jgi:hypothetical protein
MPCTSSRRRSCGRKTDASCQARPRRGSAPDARRVRPRFGPIGTLGAAFGLEGLTRLRRPSGPRFLDAALARTGDAAGDPAGIDRALRAARRARASRAAAAIVGGAEPFCSGCEVRFRSTARSTIRSALEPYFFSGSCRAPSRRPCTRIRVPRPSDQVPRPFTSGVRSSFVSRSPDRRARRPPGSPVFLSHATVLWRRYPVDLRDLCLHCSLVTMRCTFL